MEVILFIILLLVISSAAESKPKKRAVQAVAKPRKAPTRQTYSRGDVFESNGRRYYVNYDYAVVDIGKARKR
jgi:hypothetical protein